MNGVKAKVGLKDGVGRRKVGLKTQIEGTDCTSHVAQGMKK